MKHYTSPQDLCFLVVRTRAVPISYDVLIFSDLRGLFSKGGVGGWLFSQIMKEDTERTSFYVNESNLKFERTKLLLL